MMFRFRHLVFTMSLSPLTAATWARAPGPLSTYTPPLTPELKARLANVVIAAGARYFERKCSQCHDGEKTGTHAKGPWLWNVFGRRAGSIAGFGFSAAMKSAGVVWGFATLDCSLTDTERAVPGRAMNFAGIADPALRAAVVVYSSRLNDTPPALP
ncbi:c-type cytochrome [Sulfuricystis multivorans]|uniref:c-type cytochrome n=1 Tax=Sulfuricystis multivorans TaxID=2211108 RepID=UPI000F84368B|nr:c-type cytochrome [Sulfuricystis multivorans]